MVAKIAGGIVLGFVLIVGGISVLQAIGTATSDKSGEFGQMADEAERMAHRSDLASCNAGNQAACDRVWKKQR